jgi:hypothetical protein
MADDWEDQISKGVQFSNDTFPAKYFEEQEDEKLLRLKEDFIAGTAKRISGLGGDKVSVNYTPDQKDAKVWLRKTDEARLMHFEQWFEHKNKGDKSLATMKLMRELYPEYFERRIQLIDQHTHIQKKLAVMKLYGGPRTKEDLKLLYLLENDLISQPDKVAFDTTPNAKNIQRGLLNYKSIFYGEKGGEKGVIRSIDNLNKWGGNGTWLETKFGGTKGYEDATNSYGIKGARDILADQPRFSKL